MIAVKMKGRVIAHDRPSVLMAPRVSPVVGLYERKGSGGASVSQGEYLFIPLCILSIIYHRASQKLARRI